MEQMSHNQVLELLGLEIQADSPENGTLYRRVSDFAHAEPDSIVFAQDAAAVEVARQSPAGLILVPKGTAGARMLAVARPKHAFTLIGQALRHHPPYGIHATAVVDPGAQIGQGTSVGAGTIIEGGVTIGPESRIGSRVTILRGTTLGARVVVQAGAVVGSTGFGYVTSEDGTHLLFPQIGTLVIGDDVDVGANCTIDRGALGATTIGRGTKIDNLVHIAHNCQIGENVLIAAQVGIAGSCVVEDGAVLAGQVGLGEKVRIGQGVIVGAQGGVPTGKRLRGAGEMFWGTPARPIREYLRDLARLRRGR